MEITISHLLEGARQARGLAVIIDVFRAFSLECHLFARGADRVLAVGSLEKAYELKNAVPDAVLVGERKGKPLPGFDCGNSPALIRGTEIEGRTVIHTTSAGTQGIDAASSADEVITGSLVNAAAVAEYIRRSDPSRVSLVCMGLRAKEIAPEDLMCAEYIRSLLLGEPWDDNFLSHKSMNSATPPARVSSIRRNRIPCPGKTFIFAHSAMFSHLLYGQTLKTGILK